MDAKRLLLAQTRHHYAHLDRATADLSAAQAAWTPGAGRPSVAWLVGHLIGQVESTAEAVAGVLPDGADVPEEWSALRLRWSRAAERALAGLETLTLDDLEAAPLVPIVPGLEEALATRARWWSGHVFHVAYHLGQVGSLRAGQGLGWPGSSSDCQQGPPAGA